MSSLLQFNGRCVGNKVGLIFEIEIDYKNPETFVCPLCGKEHIQIYEAFRRPRGMFGCWVLFEYNGKIHGPDLSLPIGVDRIPRGARKMTAEECHKYWMS